jgi:hypothetical protein
MCDSDEKLASRQRLGADTTLIMSDPAKLPEQTSVVQAAFF